MLPIHFCLVVIALPFHASGGLCSVRRDLSSCGEGRWGGVGSRDHRQRPSSQSIDLMHFYGVLRAGGTSEAGETLQCPVPATPPGRCPRLRFGQWPRRRWTLPDALPRGRLLPALPPDGGYGGGRWQGRPGETVTERFDRCRPVVTVSTIFVSALRAALPHAYVSAARDPLTPAVWTTSDRCAAQVTAWHRMCSREGGRLPSGHGGIMVLNV
jgi:hypothetical protein